MTSPLCSRRVVPLALLLVPLAAAACARPVEPVFTLSTGGPSRADLVPVKDGVLVGNEAGALWRLDSRGQTVWRVELGQEVAVAPSVAGDSVLVGTTGGTLLALGLSGGEERWRLTGQAAPLAPLVSDAESAYVVEPGGTVRALTVRSGETRWVRAVTSPPSRARPLRLLPASLLAQGVLVVAGPGDMGLAALSPADGAVRWRLPVSQVLGMREENETLYVSTRGGDVYALGLARGDVRWKRTLAPTLTSPPSLALGRVWVGTAFRSTPFICPGKPVRAGSNAGSSSSRAT